MFQGGAAATCDTLAVGSLGVACQVVFQVFCDTGLVGWWFVPARLCISSSGVGINRNVEQKSWVIISFS